MNNICQEFFDLYFQMSFLKLQKHYSNYENEIPSVMEFFDFLKANKQLEKFIDSNSSSHSEKGCILLEINPSTFEVSTIYRGEKLPGDFFNNLEDAVYEKIKRLLGGLYATRR